MALLRSYLFAPGNDERLLAKVFDAGADGVVLDLEDAVPAGETGRARQLMAAALRARPQGGRPAVFVRINSTTGSAWREDLAAVLCPALAGVRLPKVESPDAVWRADAEIARLERRLGLSPGCVELSCTIETARGVLQAAAIAAAAPRVRNLGFGAADFTQDVGADPDGDETETLHARSLLVVASRAAGLDPPVASVHTQLADEEGLRRTSEAARRLGFYGRSCVHPRQLAIVHQAFAPRALEVERARGIVDAYAAAAGGGKGVVVLAGGQFVDAAVARRAKKILEIAGLAQEEEAGK